MNKGWILSKIISSEYFVTLVVSVIGILTVAGVIEVRDPNSIGEVIAKAIAGVVTLILGGTYTMGRIEIKKEELRLKSPEVLG